MFVFCCCAVRERIPPKSRDQMHSHDGSVVVVAVAAVVAVVVGSPVTDAMPNKRL